MFTQKLKIHFIGIGGIGVSALAQYYLSKGHKVSGSDLVSSEITEALKEKGIKLLIGKHKAENLPKRVDMVIYSPAVTTDNPELKEAKKKEIKYLSYPEALGELTKKYFTIAVSGTHGKSTTTAMIGLLLVKAGLDPTVIVGTKLKEFDDTNCRVGKSRYLVIEADEYMASFLNYWPKIIVLPSIEKDHLDYYKNLNNILKSFKEYIFHLLKDGTLVKNNDDKNIRKIKYTGDTCVYSLKQPEAKKLKKILKIPGEHNISNALAALTVARILKIPDRISFKALSEYKGSWRRFEEKKIKIRRNENSSRCVNLISDYGHHPTEIKVTLKAAREKYPEKKIWCIYQPHQYQRTYYLFADFVKAFKQALRPTQGKPQGEENRFSSSAERSEAGDERSSATPFAVAREIDKIIITDIYDVAGREEENIKKKVSSQKLVKAVKKNKVIYLPKRKILNYLKKNLSNFDILIIMGAGDIYTLANYLTEKH